MRELAGDVVGIRVDKAAHWIAEKKPRALGQSEADRAGAGQYPQSL